MCGVKPTVSDKSQYSKQLCGVDATMSPQSIEGEMLILQDGSYPYSDTSRTYAPNTRICGYVKGRFPPSLATAKPRFYESKFGQPAKVTL
jgi:hypothetical protein